MAKKKSKQNIVKKLFYWLMIAGFLYFISQSLGNFEEIASAIREGNPLWLLIAVLFEILHFIFFTKMGHRLLLSVGVKIKFESLLQLFMVSPFLNVAAPGGFFGHLYMMRKVAEQTNTKLSKASVALMTSLMDYYVSFIIIIFIGVWRIASQGVTYSGALGAAIIFSLIMALLVMIYFILYSFPDEIIYLYRHSGPFGKFIDWLFKKSMKGRKKSWLEAQIKEISKALKLLWKDADIGKQSIISGLVLHFIHMTVLYYVFLAFNVNLAPGLVLASYSITFLFSLISPTPQGLGVVEGIFPVIVASLGVASSKALLVILAYRAIVLWIPMLIGFIMFRRVEKGSEFTLPSKK